MIHVGTSRSEGRWIGTFDTRVEPSVDTTGKKEIGRRILPLFQQSGKGGHSGMTKHSGKENLELL
jgi:hypothetical protein